MNIRHQYPGLPQNLMANHHSPSQPPNDLKKTEMFGYHPMLDPTDDTSKFQKKDVLAHITVNMSTQARREEDTVWVHLRVV